MPRSGPAEFSVDVVSLAWQRAFSSCERCGRGLQRHLRGWQWSAHHRQPRGMGGSRDAELGRASNCLILCGHGTSGCHGEVERERLRAVADGLIVPMGSRPVEVAVTLYLFGRCMLRDDGGVADL